MRLLLLTLKLVLVSRLVAVLGGRAVLKGSWLLSFMEGHVEASSYLQGRSYPCPRNTKIQCLVRLIREGGSVHLAWMPRALYS